MTTNPHIPAALRNLAVDSGIVLEYVDATGVRRCADPEAVLAVLNALGTPIGQVSEAARMLRSRRSARLERIVEPVTVVDDASVGKILVSLREADIDLECAIESEEGERVEWRIRRDDLVSLSRERMDGRDRLPGSRATSVAPAVRISQFHRPRAGSSRSGDGDRRAGDWRPRPIWRGLACLWDLRPAVLTALWPQLGIRRPE